MWSAGLYRLYRGTDRFRPAYAGIHENAHRLVIAAAFAAFWPRPPAASQEATVGGEPQVQGELDEIFVTARRRNEVVQDIPVAVSVLDAATLEANGTFNVQRLQQLQPSLQFYTTNPRNSAANIRGLGAPFGLTNDGIEQGVGLYVDDVYYSRAASSTLDFLDVERLEILRGPQGTLYGKNTTAGAITSPRARLRSRRRRGRDLRRQPRLPAGKGRDLRSAVWRNRCRTRGGVCYQPSWHHLQRGHAEPDQRTRQFRPARTGALEGERRAGYQLRGRLQRAGRRVLRAAFRARGHHTAAAGPAVLAARCAAELRAPEHNASTDHRHDSEMRPQVWVVPPSAPTGNWGAVL